MRGEYLLLLGGSLASVAWLDRAAGLGVARQPRRLLAALAPLEAAILAWDLLGVERWGWSSNQAVLAGPHAFGGRIPLEELLFPLVVGACSLTLWEAIKKSEVGSRKSEVGTLREPTMMATVAESAHDPHAARGLWQASLLAAFPALYFRLPTSDFRLRSEYLLSGLIACTAVAALDRALGTRLLARRPYHAYLGIMIACQLAFDGYLTARPVTIYAPHGHLGLRLPLINMPIEDLPFGLALVGLATILWERAGHRASAGDG